MILKKFVFGHTFSHILLMFSENVFSLNLHHFTQGLSPWGYSHMLAIRLCAAGKGMVFKPFSPV